LDACQHKVPPAGGSMRGYGCSDRLTNTLLAAALATATMGPVAPARPYSSEVSVDMTSEDGL
jgi:hypothetical protein